MPNTINQVDAEEPLIDPELLEGLSEKERQEALAAAAAAKRAEERAEQKALERALKRKEEERKREREQLENASNGTSNNGNGHKNKLLANKDNGGVVFIQRGKRAQPQQSNRDETNGTNGSSILAESSSAKVPSQQQQQQQHHRPVKAKQPPLTAARMHRTTVPTAESITLSQREVEAVKKSYLGKTAEEAEEERAEKRKKQRTNKKITFKFKWDEEDDTFADDDPLYTSLHHRATAGRGNKQHHHQNYQQQQTTMPRKHAKKDALSRMASINVDSVRNKPLEKMTARDWRIFRENYEIVVKGGRAPPPLRSFRESPLPPSELPSLHPTLLDALENVMKFREPTPIQRQAIPIGLQRRDLIGIAETGSGKTVAFGVPICNYLLGLPSHILNRVADEGPLALVMAPTRELALQINDELNKLLSRQKNIKTCAIIGGQQLQHQANELRKGIHILVGTPGRINECIEMAYLVLNQCSCAVLDEGDRMIDMGFAPQIESILDAMGAALKSDIEQEAYEQEIQDLATNDVPRYRVTALFSATMPLEVERMAKKYLRHPAVISIGDQDSGKNARIVQRVIFLSSPSQKERALRDLLSKSIYDRDDKTIVFVNEKKHADGVGRMVERIGRACVVLHGGKSQDQREENLAHFRRGGVVLVATDVAGRGIDIPNVTHIINYDMPTRSIENYSHRIGRTGRAGREGLATSFITEEDEGIMAPLKAYLESTGNPVPERLAKHPAASAGVQSNLIH